MLVWLGSYFFLGQPEVLACVLVPFLFPDFFIGYSGDYFDSDGTDSDGGDCRALGLAEFFDLRGNGQVFRFL